MATKIWYPELGDRVALLNGETGYVVPRHDFDLANDGDSWLVGVTVQGRESRVLVAYSERNDQWEEQERWR